VVFADDIGMAAAFGAGGVKARIEAHLDAGCDVVPVCHPDLVEEALQAVEGRTLASSGLAGMMGREAPAWDALIADARYGRAQARIGEVPVSTHDVGVTSGANDEANAT
jgi:beta-N-acetylhexosaminidase